MNRLSLFVLAALLFAFAPSVHAADQYSWSASYIVTQGTGKTSATLEGGPFSTQSACYNDAGTKPKDAGAIQLQSSVGNGGFTCTCDTPIAEQGSACPGYTAAAAQATAQPSSAASQGAPPQGSSNFVPLAEIPGLTQGLVANSTGLSNFLNNLYKYLIGLAGALAVIEIMIGGMEIATQRDSVAKQLQAKGRIRNAILGLVLILSPYVVFSIINPSILNLSLNLEPLPVHSGWTPVSTQLTTNPTQATPEQQNPTGYGTPTGHLIACDASGDCRAAQQECANSNNPVAGFNVLANQVVCVKSGGTIDSAATGTSCPAGETKEVNCVVQVIPTGG